jgi:hypothetical protein
MSKGIIVSPANRGVQVVVTDENNVQLLVDSNRGVNLEIVPQPRIEVLVDKGVAGPQGPAGEGVPTGGTTGQVLAKASNANYDTAWTTITGTLSYQGAWNASTNTPTLTSSIGTNGYYYVVSTSGSTNLNGITDWVVGDWAIFNGSVWQKIDNTDLVTSVNGQTGEVVLTASSVGALAIANNLSDLANAATARSNLGLGTAATQDSTAFATAAQGALADTAIQALTSTDGSVTISGAGTTKDLSVAISGATTNVLCLVRNTTGATLTKGTVVYISGATGQNPTVSKAIATSDATSAQTLGMMTADLANNSNGYVTVIGLITNIDTSAYTDGQQLYLSGTTAGAVTGTKPSAPIHLVYVAVVEHAHPTQGKLFVKVQNGYELNEIHDVQIVSPTTGQTIVYNSSNQLWQNNTVSLTAGVNGTLPVSNGGTGATTLTGYVKGNGTSAFTASATVPSSDITGLGTMSTQNANSVAITGGAIDGTVIGGTTSAAGTFTTLTATGTSYLGGSSTSRGIQVDPVAGGTTTYTQFTRNAGINEQQIVAANTANLGLISTGGGAINFYTASNNTQKQLVVANTGSAVNYVQVTGAATGAAPSVISAGSDSSSNLALSSKGTGSLYFYSNSSNANSRHLDIIHNGSVINRFQLTGANAGSGVVLGVNGGDTNISQVFQSKGTGAIDLAAGSSGVNISNGGTVTALAVTNAGTSGYTSHPTPAITAPTTAGGVQATASSNLYYLSTLATTTIVSGGTGYTLNDVITVSGGTFTTAATFTVSAVSGGVVTAITPSNGGTYSVIPTGTLSVTGGTGSGFTLTINGWAVRSLTITNAGSGYVEQPTVTFSGGGGSGAAAYATVGSGTVVKSIGTTLDFYTPNANIGFRISDSLGTGTNYWSTGAGYSSPYLWARGSTNTNGYITSNGTGVISLQTNGGAQEQLRVAHTASAVNYVQVTGAATGSRPTLSAQGSDSAIGLTYTAKGSGIHALGNGNGTQLVIQDYGSTTVNRIEITPAATGVAPKVSAGGTDTNIDLTLTPKGTGLVRFGTYTAGAPTATGYISIKAADGTTYKVLVGT